MVFKDQLYGYSVRNDFGIGPEVAQVIVINRFLFGPVS